MRAFWLLLFWCSPLMAGESESVGHIPRMCWVTHVEPARCVFHPGYHFAGPWYDMGDEWHRVWYWQPPWTEHVPAKIVRRLEPCHNLHILYESDDERPVNLSGGSISEPVERKPVVVRRKR